MTLLSLSTLLSSGRNADHPIALREGIPINFERFRADVMAAAAHFKSCKKAALVCQDSYYFSVGFYGLLYAGSRIIFPSNNQPKTLESLKDCDLLVSDAVIETLSSVDEILKPLDSEKYLLDFFTSGSTGAPNCINKNLAMLESEIATLESLWGPGLAEAPVFSTVSHQHIYGLTFKILWPLAAGRPFTAETYTLWESLLNDLTPHAVIISSPAHLSRLSGLKSLSIEKRPRQIFSAGAPLSIEASQDSEAILGCRPIEIFGSTETGAIATRTMSHANEVWNLLPGLTMRRDEEGRMVLRSPFVGPDWITTSDLIEPLDEGFRFLGRADRVVKIEGKRVNLLDVEAALCELLSIKAAAVAQSLEGRSCLVAAIILSEEGEVGLSKLGAFRFSKLLQKALTPLHEASSIPRKWRFVSELPTHNMGKSRDADILALFAETL